MTDRLERKIRDQTLAMYDSAPPIGDLLPSEMAEELGVGQSLAGAISLRQPPIRPRIRGVWVGAAVFLVILLVSIPTAIWLTASDQEGFVAEPTVPMEQPRPGMMQNPANSHFYEVIPLSSDINAAMAEAAARSFRGQPGHLVTITSEQEDNFVWGASREMLSSAGDPDEVRFLGGIQSEGSNEPNSGWQWTNGEPFVYSNWADGEPNNSGGNENCMEYAAPARSPAWNDVDCPYPGASGYWIVEYDISSP